MISLSLSSFRLAIVMIVLLFSSSTLVLSSSPTTTQPKQFGVFGYLPEYRLNGFNYSAAFNTGLTHLIFFSIEVHPNGNLKALDRVPDDYKLKQARTAADKVGGKVLLGLGGNARSHGFDEVFGNPAALTNFIENIRKICTEKGFNGVDLNHEYPRADSNWGDWSRAMARMKKELGGKNFIITFTIYLDPNHYHLIMKHKMLDSADYVLCMAYDQRRKHSTTDFMMTGIQYAKDYRVPLDQFAIGVPFYGRDLRTGDPKTYNELIPEIKKQHGKKAFTADPTQFDKFDIVGNQYYNSRATIAHKTKIAIEQNVGGVMIWEIGQDKNPLSHKKSLMSALNSVLPKRNGNQAGENGDL